MSWSTSELRVRLAPLNRFKPSSKIFYWPFQGGTSFVDLLCFCSVSCLLCLCARLFICALWSPAGKGLTSWLSFVVSNCEFVTFLLVFWVRCGTWLYRFLIFAPLLTFFNLHKRWLSLQMGHPVNVQIRRTMHLSSVIPANYTRESVFRLRNFPRRMWGSNLGPLAPEASALTTEPPFFQNLIM